MNKQQEVIQAIKMQLPRLMELEKGCFFTEIFPHKKVKREIYEIKKGEIICSGITYFGTTEEMIDNVKFEIIGKEPTILDFVSLLNHDEYSYYVDCFGEHYISSNCSNSYISFQLDYGKPYIKDLDEETINFLHSVLCKK